MNSIPERPSIGNGGIDANRLVESNDPADLRPAPQRTPKFDDARFDGFPRISPRRTRAERAQRRRTLANTLPVAASASGRKSNTDPSTRDKEQWLRREFKKMRDNITDEASKPSREILERVISGSLKPVAERTINEVYWEHILLRFIDNVPLDIDRNYAEGLTLTLCGTAQFIVTGHKGIARSARTLKALLDTTEYVIIDTVIRETGEEGGWVTERWGYNDGHKQVVDGIDTFLIRDGKIIVKMINYTVEDAQPADVFYHRIGVPLPSNAGLPS
mgnify:CR=1 FL=1